jgi:hypothetical protein
MTFLVGNKCFIVGHGGVKEVIVDREQDADGYCLVELNDGQIISALATQMYPSINDCIDDQVLMLENQIEFFNAQRLDNKNE